MKRRNFLKGAAAAAAGAAALPRIWVPNEALAQTSARGTVKHLVYVRLSGGFRFTAAFNAEVNERYNPFGRAEDKPEGCEWGASSLLSQSGWLNEERQALGMKSLLASSDEIAVLPCVDHEPTSGSADGNHGTGLERYLTGYVGGSTSIFTMINYGLRERTQQSLEDETIILPAFTLGNAGMARGTGAYAAYRPPVLSGNFEGFGFEGANDLPDWAREMSANHDARMRDRHHPDVQAPIDAYIQTREATKRYAEVFGSELLRVGNRSEDIVDGISNAQLETMFGGSRAGRNLQLALRLFHYGCPAVYLDQGGYDMHSGEENGLPGRISELNQLLSALIAALKLMDHPSGGKYWDHTLVVLGSEFGRTTRGNKFNSARGSDHGGDLATRWMSMPIMGGVISQAGNQGKSFGVTRPADLKAEGPVYSYRGLAKTLMDALGCDHREFFPADEPFDDLFR